MKLTKEIVEKLKAIVLDAGMYTDAVNKGIPFVQYLEDVVAEKGLEPTPFQGKSLLQRMAIKKSTENSFMSAYDMLLAAWDIKAFGSYTDPVAKFFQNSSTATLFPEWVSSRVFAGALRSSIVPFMIANVTEITGLDYRKIMLQDTEPDRQLAIGSRAAEFPEVSIAVGSQLVSLTKYGRSMLFDYEVLQSTPLALYSTVLMRTGDQIGIDESDDLVIALLNGDGNSNGLENAQTVATATSGAISKIDIIGLASSLPDPYQATDGIGRTTYIRMYWDTLSDMQNPAVQWNQTGLPLPNIRKYERSVLTSDLLLVVDRQRAASYVTNSQVALTETERIIKKQQVRTVVSKRGVFDIMDQDAIGALNVVA